METATFGAGCFWGVEALFRRLKGVRNTAVGYSGGYTQSPTYEQVCTDRTGHAEVVRVEFDPAEISYEQLLETFFANHDPTTLNRQGPDWGSQYRSAVFYHSEAQRSAAESAKQRLNESGTFRRPIVTVIEPAAEFYPAEDYHQQYLEKRGRSSCHLVACKPMCGRLTLRTPMSRLVEQFHLPFLDEVLPPRYNIAPSQVVAAVRTVVDGTGRELVALKWGLVPAWADDPAIGNRMINARAETASVKTAFRAAFRQRRCLVPADGFFEWQAIGKEKQPHYITLRDGGLFAIAGLWERWERDDRVIESCTLLTTVANSLMEPLHDRMPVILPPDAYQQWLDPRITDASDLARLLIPYPADALAIRPVNPVVNSPARDDPRCISAPAQQMLF